MATVLYTQSFNPFRELDRLASGLLQAAGPASNQASVDLVKTGDDTFEVRLAVPGYARDELHLTVEAGVLTVKGEPHEADADGQTWLYRGIARARFERRFNLAEHVEVRDAALKDGVLRVTLARVVPEALKPRSITINEATATEPQATLPAAA